MTAKVTSHQRPRLFHTTSWTQVGMAKANSEEGQKALRDLCEAYYEPVVTYLRCAFGNEDAARDMGHAFFADILRGSKIDTADRDRGRFRSYLLGAVKHFVSHSRHAAHRLKRGGRISITPLDGPEVVEITNEKDLPPDVEFDRQWAMTVIARSMDALRAGCEKEGREAFFDRVSGLLSGQASHGDQMALAAECGMSFDAFRMAVSRLRKRLRECVKTEVKGTLEDPSTVQDEMETLFAALAGGK